jgi:hypothetical protein
VCFYYQINVFKALSKGKKTEIKMKIEERWERVGEWTCGWICDDGKVK